MIEYLRDWYGDGQWQEDFLASLEQKQSQCGLLQHLLLAGLSLLGHKGSHDDGNQNAQGENLNELHLDCGEGAVRVRSY